MDWEPLAEHGWELHRELHHRVGHPRIALGKVPLRRRHERRRLVMRDDDPLALALSAGARAGGGRGEGGAGGGACRPLRRALGLTQAAI